MAMTMTQKILAAHAGLDHVVPGQLIRADLDMVLGNDITTPVAVNEFEKAGLTVCLTEKRFLWSWTTSHRTRTSRQRSSACSAELSQNVLM